eukprot:170481-Chlamydomonas_euryale.AAC.1
MAASSLCDLITSTSLASLLTMVPASSSSLLSLTADRTIIARALYAIIAVGFVMDIAAKASAVLRRAVAAAETAQE